MPRIRKTELREAQHQAAAAALKAELDKPRKTKRRPAPRATVHEQLLRMIETGDWSEARAAHFLALYVLGHEKVYGVEPAEILGPSKTAVNARKGAMSAAKRLLEIDFGSNPKAMARFFDWVWKREVGREKWRKENGREGSRITWQVMLAGRGILTDYRAAKLRERPRP